MAKKCEAVMSDYLEFLGTSIYREYEYMTPGEEKFVKPTEDKYVTIGGKEYLLTKRLLNTRRMMNAIATCKLLYEKDCLRLLDNYEPSGGAKAYRFGQLCDKLCDKMAAYVADFVFYYYDRLGPSENSALAYNQELDQIRTWAFNAICDLADQYIGGLGQIDGEADRLKERLDQQTRFNYENAPRSYSVYYQGDGRAYAYEQPRSLAPLYGGYGANSGSATIYKINNWENLFNKVMPCLRTTVKEIALKVHGAASRFLCSTHNEYFDSAPFVYEGELKWNPWDVHKWIELLPTLEKPDRLNMMKLLLFYDAWDSMQSALQYKIKEDMIAYYGENGTFNGYSTIFNITWDSIEFNRYKLRGEADKWQDEGTHVLRSDYILSRVRKFYYRELERIHNEIISGKKRYKDYNKYTAHYTDVQKSIQESDFLTESQVNDILEVISKYFEEQKPKGLFG